MTTVAIKYQEPVATNSIALCIPIKMLQPPEAYFISCPAVLAYTNCPIQWYYPILVPSCLVHYCLKDNKRWDCKASRTDCLNYGNPFMVTWLRCLWFPSPVCPCNYLCCSNYTHLEASLIEIVGIVIKDAVFSSCILYALKLGLDQLRIFTFRSLVVVLAVIF